MASLLDLVVKTETVSVGGMDIQVQGVSVAMIASMMQRFPSLRALLSGDAVNVGAIMASGDKIVGAVIAAGCGKPGDEAYEAKALDLPIDMQVDLIAAILKATMPGGFGPLAAKIGQLGSGFGISAETIELSAKAASQMNSHEALSA